MITNRRKIYLEVLKRKKKTYKYVFAYDNKSLHFKEDIFIHKVSTTLYD